MIKIYNKSNGFVSFGEEIIFSHFIGFREQRYYTGIAVAIGIAGLAIAGTSVGLSASGALNPEQPNLASGSAQIANLKAELLPIQRQIEAAAALGKSVTIDLPRHFTFQQMVKVPDGSISRSPADLGNVDSVTGHFLSGLDPFSNDEQQFKWVPYKADEWAEGGQYFKYGQKHPPKPMDRQVKVAAGPQTFDFSGYGQADIQGAIADKMAQVGLAFSQKYDPQFIAEALKEQELANPEGTAARKREYDLIQQQNNSHPDQPVADLLHKQVSDRLNAGKGLDEFDKNTLNDAVLRAQSSRGGSGTAPVGDFSAPLTTGTEGNRRQMEGIQEGMGWLGSGATPEDVSYRREQQNLANLSSFENQQTPTSQFHELSGAQNGPAPMTAGVPLPTTQGNPVMTASGAAGTTFNQMANQPNSWFAGLSSLINAGNTVANGYSSIKKT